MRDYKKGKFLLESRPGQLLPIGVSKDGRSSAAAEQQQKRILDKVWASVEKAMGEMRNVLLSQLQDHTRSIDEQEKTLECATLVSFPIRNSACADYWSKSPPMKNLHGLTLTDNTSIS